MDMKVWRFYVYVWSSSPLSSSSQTFKVGLSNSGSMNFHTSSSFTNTSSSSSKSGFMGYSPQNSSSGIDKYNYEGWTGGWRAFNSALTDTQINYLYNSGKGRF